MSECIFCSIVDHKVPADFLFEDDLVIAVMDIDPANPGHVLVIPKRHSNDLSSAPESDLAALIAVCAKVGILQKIRISANGFNILSASGKDAQQSVFHTHFHVIPRFADDGFDLWVHGKTRIQMSQRDAFLLMKK